MTTRLADIGDADNLVVASAVTSLPFPPVAFGLVPASWSSPASGSIKEFDVNLYAVAAVVLSNTTLYAGKRFLATLTPAVIGFASVDATLNTFTKTNHGLYTGDGAGQWTTSGVLPANVLPLTDYYIIKVDDNTFKIATSIANAISGVAVDIGDQGSGNHTFTGNSDAKRFYWSNWGTLGTVTLDVQLSFTVTADHSSGVVAYAVAAGFNTTVATTVQLDPRVEVGS